MKRLSDLGTNEYPDEDLYAIHSELQLSENLRILRRFLAVSAMFHPDDMSKADINDTYSEIAAGLYND